MGGFIRKQTKNYKQLQEGENVNYHVMLKKKHKKK